MSKNDILYAEHNFEAWSGEGEGFRLHQTGRMRDMREWRHERLSGPFWRCYHHTRSGSAIRINRRLIPLRAEEIVLIPENNVFDARGVEGPAHYWIHFSPPLRWAAMAKVLRLPIGAPLAGLLQQWRGMMSPPSHDAHRSGRLFHTCQAVLHACFAQIPLPAMTAISPGLRTVLEEIERSLATPPDNGVLARRAGRSMEGFIRWFRSETGTTPARYVMGRRVRQASRLLAMTDRSIEEVAEAVGFANRHHFTRVFGQSTGRPPARFRSEQRKLH